MHDIEEKHPFEQITRWAIWRNKHHHGPDRRRDLDGDPSGGLWGELSVIRAADDRKLRESLGDGTVHALILKHLHSSDINPNRTSCALHARDLRLCALPLP